MAWFYYVARAFCWLSFKVLTRFRIRGRENIPATGPLVIVSNHLSMADPPLIAASFGRKVIFMAKKELFRWRIIGAFLGAGAFPVERGRLGRKALRQSLKLIASGHALAVFPEGRRSSNGRMRPALPGAALIAARSGAPVLPVAVTGTEQFRRRDWPLRRPVINVTIGLPFRLPLLNGKLTREALATHATDIMENIAAMLPPEYRGHYAERKLVGTTD